MKGKSDMFQDCYGTEPFDLRLTVLRMVRQLHIVAAVTLAGTLIFGGGYFVKNVLLRGETKYAATSTYRVEYAIEEEKDLGSVYINEYSWNTYVHSRIFLDMVRHNLSPDYGDMSDEELAGILTATLASDLRVPSITTTTDDPEKSVEIARAVESAMVEEFGEIVREIVSVSVIDPGRRAEEIIPDVRVGRAVVLSAVLSCFFAVVALLLKETWDDSIYLPVTLWRRYGLKTVGALGALRISKSMETTQKTALRENLNYLFSEKKRVAVCPVQDGMDVKILLDELRAAIENREAPPSQEVLETTEGDKAKERYGNLGEWFGTETPFQEGVCEQLRSADGILLAVRAGRHARRRLEWVLEYLQTQDCKITAAILTDADEKLLRQYYFCNGRVKREINF